MREELWAAVATTTPQQQSLHTHVHSTVISRTTRENRPATATASHGVPDLWKSVELGV